MKTFDFGTLGAPFEADWPVIVSVPLDGGLAEEQRFMLRLRMLDEAAFEAATDPLKHPDGAGMFRAAIVGFPKGSAEEWSEEMLAKLISVPYVRRAIAQAIGGFRMGVAAKNA